MGPSTFLAGRHPSLADAAAGAHAHLGLIRTTDAGRTWTAMLADTPWGYYSLTSNEAHLHVSESS